MIEAGPETDMAVAKACRLGYQANLDGSGKALVVSVRPSVDLTDAFIAAEKFGLFDRHCCQMGKLDENTWDVSKYEDTNGRNGFYHLASGPTAALALCAAILKLAESAVK